MKLYDFECQACGRRFEDLVQDVAEAECPSCGSAHVAKQLSSFAVAGSRGEPNAPAPAACGPCCGGGVCGVD